MWPKLKPRSWQWRGILISAPSVAALVIGVHTAGLFQLLEWMALDSFFRWRPLEAPDPRIVVVTIDEADITYAGQWPIPDAVLAQLLENLNSYRPRAIGMDLYRDLPVPPGHDRLVEVLEAMPNLIGVEKVAGDRVGPPAILAEQGQVGLADLVLDADGKVRRGLLSVKPDDGETKLGLATRLSLMYLEAEGIALELADPEKMHLKLGKALFVPFAENDGSYVRADAGGYQILLNYRGPQTNFTTVSMTDILEKRADPEILRDRLVLIGATGQSLNDLFFTPYTNSLWGVPKRMPGVVIHANLASQILAGALDGRPFLQVWNDPAEWLWTLAWSFVGASGGWGFLQSNCFKNNLFFRGVVLGGGILVGCAIAVGSSYFAFLHSWWIPTVPPVLALSGSAIAIAGYHSRTLQRQSDRRLAKFLEAMPIAVAVLDRDGKPYYANQTAQALLGKGAIGHVTIEQLSEFYNYYRAGTDTLYPWNELPIVRALYGESIAAEDIEIRTDDRVTPISAMGMPIFDEDNQVAYALVTFQDITERRQAEAEREQFTKELFDLNQNLEKALDAELELTDAYGRFVPHQFLYFLGYESITDVKLGEAVQKEMSILFTDIRNFTTLSESMNPEDNFKFINAFLSRMEPAIAENNGFIDKYIGDAIMALFSGSADESVRAAISMLQRLQEYNLTRGRPGRPKIQIGIGINTGSLMLGTVGGSNRMDGTVIGDAVNLAARIESLTKDYGVALLISNQTFVALDNPSEYHVRLIDRVRVKGKSQLVTVYEVFDADAPDIKQGKLETKTIFEQALLLYNLGSYLEAAHLFQNCLNVNHQDNVARIYLKRCHCAESQSSVS
jgi:adenylate cyclase